MNRRKFCTVVVGAATMLFSQGLCFAQTPLWDGLISYWPLNEGTGATAGDIGPAGSVADSGTLNNAPTWITSGGPFNTGLQFNGTDQEVLIPNSTDMDINTGGVTISAWVKLDQLPSGMPTTFGGIFDSQPDNYVLYLDKTARELRFKVTTATVAAERPGIPERLLNTNNWVHVMGVYDGAGSNARIYLNGQLTDVHTTPALLNGTVRSGQVTAMGADANTPIGQPVVPASNRFPGGITDVAVWNRALGTAEAQYLYNSGAGNAVGAVNQPISPLAPIQPIKPVAEPVVYYNFDNNLNNHGTGGAIYNAIHNDAVGLNDALYTSTTFGQGLDLRQNPDQGYAANAGDFLQVAYTMTDQGSITMRFKAVPGGLHDFQSIWGNSSNGNDWEAWVYGDGRFAARIDRATGSLLPYSLFNFAGTELEEHHYTFTWERDGSNVQTKLYVDGEFEGQLVTPWRDPGTTVYIGGGPGNEFGSFIYDEFRIYDVALTEAQALYLSQTADAVPIPVSGDFDGDGDVDGADFVAWQTNFPKASGATAAQGDADGDQDVDGADFAVWRDTFGQSPGQSPVPEPASAVLLIGSCLAGLLARRKWRVKS